MDKIIDRQKRFIERAKIVHHNENIDYSKVEYINNRTKVCLIDHDLKDDGSEYGEFWQSPSNHLKGQSHPLKRVKKIISKTVASSIDVINRFNLIHIDENLDYSEVEYVNMHTKVKIIDHSLREDGSEYGEFWQEPIVHLKGFGHPDRYRKLDSTDKIQSFIKLSNDIHNNKYDYSNVQFSTTKDKVDIICPIHGIFKQEVNSHLIGRGCKKCANDLLSISKKLSMVKFKL